MTLFVESLYAVSSDEIAVCMEIRDGERTQREKFTLGAVDIADLGVVVGECDREKYDAIRNASETHRAVRLGANLLGYGRASEKALVRKLIMKGISKEVATEAVRRLRECGYIDPDRDAAAHAELCTRKLWGRRRITAELYQKGYSDQSIKKAIAELEQTVDFSELCYERLSRLGELPEDRDKMRKLVASLVRYGFSSDEIKEAIKRAL